MAGEVGGQDDKNGEEKDEDDDIDSNVFALQLETELSACNAMSPLAPWHLNPLCVGDEVVDDLLVVVLLVCEEWCGLFDVSLVLHPQPDTRNS